MDAGIRHNGHIRRAAHGYEPTREAAMAAFAKSWRQRVMVLASPPADAKEQPRRWLSASSRGWPLLIRATLYTRAPHNTGRLCVHMPAPLIRGKITVTFGNAGDVLVLNAHLGNRQCAHCRYRSCCDYGCSSDDQLHCRNPPVGGPIGIIYGPKDDGTYVVEFQDGRGRRAVDSSDDEAVAL